jgi:uncharacterized protein YukE
MRRMPTPESAAAFAKLVSARTKLNEITKQLNDAHAEISAGGQGARQRYAELQTEWDKAFRAFELATEEFAATVKHLHDDVEAHRAPIPKDPPH